MILQLASDLHLSEYNRCVEDTITPMPGAVLILAGDVLMLNTKQHLVRDPNYEAGYKGLVNWLADNFRQVFMVMGNHEFFRKRFDDCMKLMDEINRLRPNFRVLYNEAVCLEGNTWLAGTTLWSDIKSHNSFMDGKKIYGWELEDNNREHRCSRSWLTRTLADTTKKWIVVTHHAPSLYETSHFHHNILPDNSSYCSDLDHLVRKAKVWMFGHTHKNVCMEYESGSFLVSNCMGKRSESIVNRYSERYTINI